MTKKIVVLVKGIGDPKLKDVKIEQGTTINDLKRSLKQPQSARVLRKETGEFLANNVDLHTILNEGEKLDITQDAELGF